MCGGSNPVDDLFSSAGDALADLDDTVAETIPGGWMTAARLAMMANGMPTDGGMPVEAGAFDTAGFENLDLATDAASAAQVADAANEAQTLSDLTQTAPPPSLPGDVSQGSNFPGEMDDYGQPLNRGMDDGGLTPKKITLPPEDPYAGIQDMMPGFDGSSPANSPFSLSNLGNSALGGVKSVGNWAMKNPIPAMYAGGSLYDMYAKNKMAKKQEGLYNQNRADIMNAYAPGSAEYNQMAQAMARKDAAAGRNSQYGTRSSDLAATLAKMRMNSLTQLQGSQNTLANQSMSNQYGMFNTPLALAMYSQRPRSRATPIE
jgi:hypothetical protein